MPGISPADKAPASTNPKAEATSKTAGKAAVNQEATDEHQKKAKQSGEDFSDYAIHCLLRAYHLQAVQAKE